MFFSTFGVGYCRIILLASFFSFWESARLVEEYYVKVSQFSMPLRVYLVVTKVLVMIHGGWCSNPSWVRVEIFNWSACIIGYNPIMVAHTTSSCMVLREVVIKVIWIWGASCLGYNLKWKDIGCNTLCIFSVAYNNQIRNVIFIFHSM